MPLGFNNTYALALRESEAERLGVTRISDLARLPGRDAQARPVARIPGARRRLAGIAARLRACPSVPARALDHGLAYDALAAGQVDLIDIYSTDAKVGRYRLRVLEDDRRFFPRYDAVLLMRAGVDERPLQRLAGRIDEAAMIALNAQVELDGLSFAEAARRFLAGAAPGSSCAGRGSSTASLRPTWRG